MINNDTSEYMTRMCKALLHGVIHILQGRLSINEQNKILSCSKTAHQHLKSITALFAFKLHTLLRSQMRGS